MRRESSSYCSLFCAELPCSSAWRVDEEAILLKKRRDLRDSHLVMSIDPKGCEDVDDTLSFRQDSHSNGSTATAMALLPSVTVSVCWCCRQLENGCVELGVHIADVSHFVREDSMVDMEARARSTTVYLADRRYDMLPALLSADLCSLLSQVDRFVSECACTQVCAVCLCMHACVLV